MDATNRAWRVCATGPRDQYDPLQLALRHKTVLTAATNRGIYQGAETIDDLNNLGGGPETTYHQADPNAPRVPFRRMPNRAGRRPMWPHRQFPSSTMHCHWPNIGQNAVILLRAMRPQECWDIVNHQIRVAYSSTDWSVTSVAAMTWVPL